ncbi:hypothetical protein HII31_03455 [Pseudocercospora fuligena]|uniref:ASST-domain-containing protein n=1 Tax=Pseudocercospora fuligena TaxID=685502 RepID=A0A8H6RPP9_9PEZI|nr:hypothetical protein HII31_03455 [Pseudocercospora fuligena]
MSFLSIVLFCLAVPCICLLPTEQWHDSAERWQSEDLHHFVTRPDLRAPKWHVIQIKQDLTEPGYLFVTPYSNLQRPVSSSLYSGHQIGPHIYSSDGELVWSGAHLFPGQTTFDFKVAELNSTPHLTFAVGSGPLNTQYTAGFNIILNSSYHLVESHSPTGGTDVDLHEFTILGDGKSALVTRQRAEAVTYHDTGTGEPWKHLMLQNGLEEFDIYSGRTIFEWWAHDHISPSESTFDASKQGPGLPWDWYHISSIDKDDQGDYLVSIRHTNAIYLVSGSTRKILWQLGGKKSSFKLEGFHFSSALSFGRQHDARIRLRNSTVTIISIFNNAADENSVDEDDEPSSLLEMALYTAQSPMIAKVIRHVPRPNRGRTTIGGNYQYLPNGNVLGAWGDNAYITEHLPSGKVVYETSFLSTRFLNYRAYKLPWIGRPSDTPVVKALASTTKGRDLTTIFYVSWNGATEVSKWNFYSADLGDFDVRRVGSTIKNGFETSYVVRGHHAIVFAEAIDKDGNSLSNSTLVSTELPLSWHKVDFEDDDTEDSSHDINTPQHGHFKSVLVGVMVLIVLVLLYARKLFLERTLRRASRYLQQRKRAKDDDRDILRFAEARTGSFAQGTGFQR